MKKLLLFLILIPMAVFSAEILTADTPVTTDVSLWAKILGMIAGLIGMA